MAHKTLINGTSYQIGGGKTKVGGTSYSITGGKTIKGGTAYTIGFKPKILITGSPMVNASTSYAVFTRYLRLIIGGQTITPLSAGELDVSLQPGQQIAIDNEVNATVAMGYATTSRGAIYINGEAADTTTRPTILAQGTITINCSNTTPPSFPIYITY